MQRYRIPVDDASTRLRSMTEVAESRELYTLPLAEFTVARDRLAKRLRAEGRADDADPVARLRKPTVAAWALNLAARAHPEAVDELLESHRRLRRAGTKEELQEASLMRTRAVAVLTEAAMGELEDRGQAASGQTRDRVNRTLLAVATDTEGEADLEAGTLVRELEPSGAGWGDTELPPPPAPDPGHEAALAAEKARDRARELDAAATAAEELLDAAKQEVIAARSRAKSARAAANEAAKAAERSAHGSSPT